MYVRVLNSEIAQFVTVEKGDNYPTCMPVKSDIPPHIDSMTGEAVLSLRGHSHFNVVCSLKTLYENELPLKVTPFTYFMSNRDMCFDVPDFDKERASEIRSFTYQTDNSESLRAAMEYALEISKEIMLLLLDSVNNVDKYVQFLDWGYFLDDVYYKCRNYHDIIKNEYEEDMYNQRQYIESNYTENVEERIDAKMKKISKFYDELLGQLDDTANDPDKLALKIAELEEQKRINVEKLKEMGIELREEK